MKDAVRVRERYLRDPLPRRLGGLAADLARLASSARRDVTGQSVALMLEESQHFIEWTAAETEPEVAAELAEIQVMPALWRRAWDQGRNVRGVRILLAVQARRWSDQVLARSGLLEPGESEAAR